MNIRNAQEKDVDGILHLLRQVLEVHAAIRPDIFIPGTAKYTRAQLCDILHDPSRRTFVAVDADDAVCGYAFCEIRPYTAFANIVPHTEFYIDDLCVDSRMRGQQIGRRLFSHVQQAARQLGCYEITLNVWEGNDGAKAFYDKMGMRPKSTQMEWILGSAD